MATISKVLRRKGYHIEAKGSEIDLVCGMELEADKIKFKTKYNGREYFFCSESCSNHFNEDPKKYVG